MRDETEQGLAEDRRQRFEKVYRETYGALVGYALRRVDGPADAADVVAETFLVAWRRLDDLPGGEDARPWLFGVARGVIANQRRGGVRRLALAERLRAEAMASDSSGGAGPEAAFDGAENGAAVARAFGRLGDDDREVLTLVLADDLGRDSVATILDCSRATVRVRLHRARRRFARELRSEGIDPQRFGVRGHDLSSRAHTRPASEEAL